MTTAWILDSTLDEGGIHLTQILIGVPTQIQNLTKPSLKSFFVVVPKQAKSHHQYRCSTLELGLEIAFGYGEFSLINLSI